MAFMILVAISLLLFLLKFCYSFHGIELDELEATLIQFFHQCDDGTKDVLVLVLLSLLLQAFLQHFLVHLPLCNRLVLGAIRVSAAVPT